MLNEELEKRLDLIEFRQELLFENTGLERLLFETKITRDEYTSIMDLMDKYRAKIFNKKEVTHGEFEEEIYEIKEEIRGDFGFCELLTKEFKKEGRWEEVFQVLYGGLEKYKGIL